MIFSFSGLWLIKILKGSDIGPDIIPEAELGAESFVLLQNFSQALAAKAQVVSFKIGAPDLRICFSVWWTDYENRGSFRTSLTQWGAKSFLRFEDPAIDLPLTGVLVEHCGKRQRSKTCSARQKPYFRVQKRFTCNLHLPESGWCESK